VALAGSKALKLQALADKRLTQAQALKLEARLEDLQVWEQRKVKDTKTGAKTYTYFMASWREGAKCPSRKRQEDGCSSGQGCSPLLRLE
jgi:hypothetical protein